MNIPKPSKPRSIYNGKVDTLKLFIDGKEVPWFELCEVKYGTVNFETGIVTYYCPNCGASMKKGGAE